MEEIWKDVRGYEGIYQVSNLGNVKTLKRNMLLKVNNTSKYDYVKLYKNGKGKVKKIHRLVAENFIENPNKLECVNHKDENKKNNNVNNLEWCTKKYNCNYGTIKERMSKSLSKYKIAQKDKNGNIIKIWQSVWDIEHNTSYKKGNIRCCCQNKHNYAYGYKWEYIPINL